MTSYLFVLFSCAVLLNQADSVPRWSWGKFADLENLSPNNEQLKDCTHGQCLQAWKCPSNEIAIEEPTSCSKRNRGPWICCVKVAEDGHLKLDEKSEVTTPLFIEYLIDRTNKSNSVNMPTTSDWVSVAVNVQQSKEDNASSQETMAEYKENANIVNWGKSQVYTPKRLHGKNPHDGVSYNADKPYIWTKGSTSNPLNRRTDDKWLNPVSAELRNKYPSEMEYDYVAENSWDYNHNHYGTKKTTKDWIVRTTPPSRWSSTKSSWNRDHTSNKTANKWESRTTSSKNTNPKWESRTTSSFWVRQTSETRDKAVNSRSTTNTPDKHSWTKSTKSVHKWDSNSYGSTSSKPIMKTTTRSWRSTTGSEKRDKTNGENTWAKPTNEYWNQPSTSKSVHNWDSNWYGSTTSKPIMKTTTQSWRSTTGSEKRDKTNGETTWAKPTKESWNQPSTSKSNHNWDSNWHGSTTSKPTRKITSQSWRPTAGFEKRHKTNTTLNNWAKPTKDSWNSDSSSNTEKRSTKSPSNTPTTRKSTPKVSTRASSKTVNNRLTTPRSISTKSTVGTRKPSFENIEKSASGSRRPSAVTRSTTKKYTTTTPLPDVSSQRCGIRVTSRDASRRGKRQLNSEEAVVYTDFSHAKRNRLPFQRIVGGIEAEPFSWPWVAALYRVSESGGNRFLSAGSLINRNFVLTAAHVFTPDDLRSASFVVMLGTHTAREAVAEYVVMHVLRHPDYQQRYYYNDIALLRLEQPVDFNEYVMPVCLPSPSLPLTNDKDLEGKQVTVMGWGDESYGGKTSRVLQEASFPILPRKACNESYFQVASNRFPRGITSNMLCAGDPNGGKDACQGDSGGPLTTVENGRHTQVGIVSFGFKCGDKEYPGVYTKVAPYLSWIAENARCDDHSDYDYYSG